MKFTVTLALIAVAVLSNPIEAKHGDDLGISMPPLYDEDDDLGYSGLRKRIAVAQIRMAMGMPPLRDYDDDLGHMVGVMWGRRISKPFKRRL